MKKINITKEQKKFVNTYALDFVKSFEMFFSISEFINNENPFIALPIEDANKEKDFSDALQGLIDRAINPYELMRCLYFKPAIIADKTNHHTYQKQAEDIIKACIAMFKTDSNRYRNTRNYIKKNRDIFTQALGMDVDKAIKKCTWWEEICKMGSNKIFQKIEEMKEDSGWNHKGGIDIRKQAFWTHSTIKALEFLEKYDGKYSKVSRNQELFIIAHFMQALYPRIWAGDVEKIQGRLKKKVNDYEIKQKTEELKK